MDAGPLDMLHDAGHQHVGAVGDHIHLQLGARHVLVHQNVVFDAAGEDDAHIFLHVLPPMGDDHVLAADDVGGAEQNREAQGFRGIQRLFQGGDAHALGAADAQVLQQGVEAPPVLGHVDAVGGGAQNGDALLVQELRQGDGGLAAEGHHHTHGVLHFNDPHHILRGEGLKVQPVGGVIVGGDGLRVVVDDDHVIAQLFQGLDTVDGAVIKFNALADPNGAGPQDDDGVPAGPGEVPGITVLVIGGVEIRGLGLEFRRAGVHHLIAGGAVGQGCWVHPRQAGQGLVRVAVFLRLEIGLLGEPALQGGLESDQVLQFADEPLVNLGDIVNVVHRHPLGQGLKNGEQPQVIHGGQAFIQGAAGGVLGMEAVQLDFRPPDGFHQGGLKGMGNGHDFAGGLHLGAQLPAGPVELVKGPLGELHHHIVHCGLKTGESLTGHIVFDLIQGVTQSDLGGDLGNGIARGLGGQGGGAGDPGVYLDDSILKAVRV